MKKEIRFLSLLFSFLIVLKLNAVPVKPGMWKVITLEDGKKVLVEHRGDEWLQFYADKDGNIYHENFQNNKEARYRKISSNEFQSLKKMAEMKKGENPRFQRLFSSSHSNASQSGPKKIGFKDTSLFQGTKKGLIILAEFSDVQFSNSYLDYNAQNVNSLYKRIINEIGFNEEPFVGSVRDYFRKQSIRLNGEVVDNRDYQFDLDFDVVGPVTLSKTREYYGSPVYKKSTWGNEYTSATNDAHAGAMVSEAIKKAVSTYDIDFSPYDWDGDNEVDQVFVLYAGQGQADGGDDNTIWPHEWTLSSAYSNESSYSRGSNYYVLNNGKYQSFSMDKNFSGSFKVNGYTINTYACSNELASISELNSNDEYEVTGTKIAGIGTICHEFSHCLGYPDAYDTDYSGNYGMGYWDLMASGSYNGDNCGYCPAGYTSFERWAAGWIEPTVLSDPQVITNMGSLQSTAQSYVVYARGSNKTGEYYLLENRQYDDWDYELPWNGLLIIHVDYNETVWRNNDVNTTESSSNGHQRYTIFHADKDEVGLLEWSTYPYEPDYWLPIAFKNNSTLAGKTGKEIAEYFNNLYSSYGANLGTKFNNELTSSSDPKAIYYNSTSSSSTRSYTLNNHEIHHITKFQDGTVNFVYRYPTNTGGTLTLNENATTKDNFTATTYQTVTLNRTFSPNKWNTLWLPFNLSPTEIHRVFGNDAQVALFNKTTTTKTDEGTTIDINFSLRQNSAGTEITQGTNAFEPFLIKVTNNVVNPQFEYVTITQSSDNDAQLTKDGWTFVGTNTVSKIPEGSYFITDDSFYKSLGNSNTKAYRGYFTPSSETAQMITDASHINRQFESIIDANESKISESKIMKRFNFTNFITSIDDVIVNLDEEGATRYSGVYNLNGQRISDSTTGINSLSPGIYLVNGKKYIVK